MSYYVPATIALVILAVCVHGANGQDADEITPQSEAALERGLTWLAKNQGADGSWGSADLGLVSMGALAYMAAGHAPGRGRYGRELEQALEFVVSRARPSRSSRRRHPCYK